MRVTVDFYVCKMMHQKIMTGYLDFFSVRWIVTPKWRKKVLERFTKTHFQDYTKKEVTTFLAN